MKIITWNINSIRLRIGLVEHLNKLYNPTVIGLQETKCPDADFPISKLEEMGFKHLAYSGQKGYNGVAILSKKPIEDSFSIKLYNEDKRHIAAKIDGIYIHNFYIPAGGDIPIIEENPKYKHKLEYLKLMREWFAANSGHKNSSILLGDLNIAPHEHDVWSSKQLKNVVSHTAAERESLIALQESINFIDSARFFIPFEQKSYTWWSYRNKNWEESNRGRRLDHIWVSEDLKDRLRKVESLKDARKWDRPSDHVPFILSLDNL